MQRPGNWDINPGKTPTGSVSSTGPSFFPSTKKIPQNYQPGIQSMSSGYSSFGGGMVPYQGPSFAPPPMPSLGPSFAPPPMQYGGPPPGAPPALSPEPPALVNQYGRYQSIYGWPPVWGPELIPAMGTGGGEWEQFPDVDRNWPRLPNAEIPRDWMWYRKAKTPVDWKKDWEPTIYWDTLTLQPTTRTGMLDKATDDMFDALDIEFEQARQQVDELDEEDNMFGDLQKGLDIMQHDFGEAVTGGGNSQTDKLHKQRHPKMEMGHVTEHGRHYMQLESKAKREKRVNHFAGVAPQPVDTYIGTLWKAQNPLIPDNNGIRFG